jgi:hypothetical protein
VYERFSGRGVAAVAAGKLDLRCAASALAFAFAISLGRSTSLA